MWLYGMRRRRGGGAPLPAPIAISVTSTTDAGGTVTVTGDLFTPDAVVWTDGAARPTFYVSPTTIAVNVPAHAAGSVSLFVVQASGTSNTITLTYTPSAAGAVAWLEARVAHLLQIPADHGGGATGWPGRPSAGTSGTHRFARAWYLDGSHDTIDPAAVTVGGQPWLQASGESAMGACNFGASEARTTIDIFPGAGFVLTAAWRFDSAEAGNAGPNGYRHPLGANGNSFGFFLRANGKVTLHMLNSGSSAYQQTEIGTAVVGTPCIVQLRYDNATGTFAGRVNKGAWATFAGASRTNWLKQFALFAYDTIAAPPAEAARCAAGVIESEAYTSNTTTLDMLVEKVALASGVSV